MAKKRSHRQVQHGQMLRRTPNDLPEFIIKIKRGSKTLYRYVYKRDSLNDLMVKNEKHECTVYPCVYGKPTVFKAVASLLIAASLVLASCSAESHFLGGLGQCYEAPMLQPPSPYYYALGAGG